MLRVFGSITQSHDPGLVALACLICVLATNASARLLTPDKSNESDQRAIRLGAAVTAFSTGVWATHFISILAYRPVPLGFDVPLCALSLAIAIGMTSLAFTFGPRRGHTPWSGLTIAVARGVILASGIGMMHFVGMQALVLPGVLHHQPDLVVASLGTGTLGAVTAMWLLPRGRPSLASVFLMFSVVSTHFIAVGSITLGHTGDLVPSPPDVSRSILAIATTGAFLLIVALALAASILDEHHGNRLAREARRFRTLADATFEGLVFEQSGLVADVNRAMCRLAGSDAATLIGLRLADLLPGFVFMPQPDERPLEHVVLLPDGQTRPVELLWRDDPGRGGHVVAIRDLTRQKAAESQIDRLARFDSLTGLANRDWFDQQLQKALELSDRGASGVALLYIDLDELDSLNEALGPRAGEQILVQTARRLSGILRQSDIVARLGRDEFAIVQSLVEQPSSAARLADRIVAAMALPFSVDDEPIALMSNVGIALYRSAGNTPAALIKNASLARTHAKRGGAGWRFFEPGMDLQLQSKRSLEHDLRTALKEGQFCLNYQPFITIQSQELAGYEALLRWDHPERGRIPPSDFIPLAEECGLIVPIGNWVLATACAEAVSWNDPVTISVNLSPAQFVKPGIVTTVGDVLRRTGLPAARLELEITEGALIGDTKNALRTLTALKALGVKIAMDDFGTGYSSLSYLRKFPFDKIKIDRSFISEVGQDTEAETLVQAIIALGRSMRLDVTAEGVETKRQLAMLRVQGCTFAQGYLLGRPHPADQLGQHLAKEWRIFSDDEPVARGATSNVASSA
jgi:diguanylate cyclase